VNLKKNANLKKEEIRMNQLLKNLKASRGKNNPK